MEKINVIYAYWDTYRAKDIYINRLHTDYEKMRYLYETVCCEMPDKGR